MKRAARTLPQPFAALDCEMNRTRAKLVLRERHEHVAERKPVAPDMVDHRMIGVRRGIHFLDRAVGAKMLCQIERDLHARRIFRLAFVMRELEEIRLPSAPDDETR